MRLVPAADTRHRWWTRFSLWVVFVAVVLAVVGIGWGVSNAHDTKLLAQQSLIAQTNHHNATVKQQDLIIAQNKEIIALTETIHDAQVTNKGTLTAISDLENQVANVIEGLPAADKTLTDEAAGLAQALMALCSAVHADCQPLPSP